MPYVDIPANDYPWTTTWNPRLEQCTFLGYPLSTQQLTPIAPLGFGLFRWFVWDDDGTTPTRQGLATTRANARQAATGNVLALRRIARRQARIANPPSLTS